MKDKNKTKAKCKRDAWQAFAKFIKLRDAWRTTGSPEYCECFTCNYSGPTNSFDAGHFIPGRHNANLFSERGVNAQCKSCNAFHGGRPLEYRRQLIKLYGEGVDEELEAEERKIVKYSKADLIEIRDKYRERIKEVENGS
ncbi:hypothetical protein LCGC14_1050130 [marine sediment metagenome]|uniref:Protein ninG n=1 Tax=marine sediment metagenome TaxID=412755 RepID=A0A0F9NAZ4_9ZZZZ